MKVKNVFRPSRKSTIFLFDLLQGNNPIDSFTKNIKKRLEAEPEYNNLRSKPIASIGYIPSYIKNIRSSTYNPEKIDNLIRQHHMM